MRNSSVYPAWRKIAIAICAIIAIVCTLLCVNVRNLIDYTGSIASIYKTDWYDYNEECRIGNISYPNRPWLHFGKQDWYVNEITSDLSTNNNFGELICLYSFEKDNCESVSLWVYDISKKKKRNVNQTDFYKSIIKTYCNDTTKLWRVTNSFTPALAMSTGPMMYLENYGATHGYKEYIVIFANYRIYSFHFKYENFKGNFDTFHNHCMRIAKNVDFKSYGRWYVAHKEYLKSSKKEGQDRLLLARCLILLTSVSGILMFLLAMPHKPYKTNMRARKLFTYWSICFFLIVIACGLSQLFENGYRSYSAGFCLISLFTSIIYIPSIAFLCMRSRQEYFETFMIPDWCIKVFNINTTFKKRMISVFLFIPFFYLGPIMNWIILFYIVPISIIALLTFGILWIKDGNKSNDKTNADNDSRFFCRHCGKSIDGDSAFCKYCGKKL